jgi:integrase
LFRRARAENCRRTSTELNQDFTSKGDDFFKEYTHRSTLVQHDNQDTGETIASLCVDFRGAKASEDIVNATRQKHEIQFKILTDYFGADRSLEEIRPSDARQLAAFLSSIPRHSNLKYPNKKFTEAAESEAQQDKPDTISPKTQKDYFEGIVSIFSHAVDLEFIQSNPFKNKTVSKAIPKVVKRKKKSLTQEDMAIIFGSPDFKSQQKNTKTPDKGSARFLVTLLCLFHGLRSNEAAQLLVEDIKEDDGIAYCYIREANDVGEKVKHLKTPSSERKIPIHEKLLKMGFLQYVDDLRTKGEATLFPALSQNTRGSKSDLVGKWFSGLRNKLLLSQTYGRGDKTLHSMRHGMNDVLRNAGVSEELRKAIGGWKKSGSSSEADYGQGFNLERLKEAVDQIQYPDVDFSGFYSPTKDQ